MNLIKGLAHRVDEALEKKVKDVVGDRVDDALGQDASKDEGHVANDHGDGKEATKETLQKQVEEIESELKRLKLKMEEVFGQLEKLGGGGVIP